MIAAQIDHPPAPALGIAPPQILGPFYPVCERPDLAADLACASDSGAEAQGQLIHVRGRVLIPPSDQEITALAHYLTHLWRMLGESLQWSFEKIMRKA